MIGVPSEKMVEEIAAVEKKRLAKQKKTLGAEGLKKCESKIAAAIKENTVVVFFVCNTWLSLRSLPKSY